MTCDREREKCTQFEGSDGDGKSRKYKKKKLLSWENKLEDFHKSSSIFTVLIFVIPMYFKWKICTTDAT